MTVYAVTTCARRKRRREGLLPARERYLSARISHVRRQARRDGHGLLILSGRFGLVDDAEPLPWYDQALTLEAAEALVPTLRRQLTHRWASGLVLYARPRSTPGWEPYYVALERACALCGLALEVVVLERRGALARGD